MWILPLLFLSFPIFSEQLDQLKSSIWHQSAKELSVMAFDIGKLCEYVAFMYVSEIFDETEYYFEQNLNYGASSKTSTGELDITVFRIKDKRAVQIYEVKCRHNEEEAFKEAQEQLERFKTDIKSCQRNPGKHIYIGKIGKEKISSDAFKGAQYNMLMPKASSRLKEVERFNITLEQVYALQRYLRKGLGF